MIPVRSIRLEPLGNPNQGGGIMTMDGEVIPTGVVQAHIMPSAGKVFIKWMSGIFLKAGVRILNTSFSS